MNYTGSSRQRATISLGAMTIALAIASPAFAQDSAATPDAAKPTADANEIIVTAGLREQSLQDVPIAVSVVSGGQLDAVGAGGVESITSVAPSLTFTKGSNASNSSLSVRGIGTTVFSAATEPAVSVVIDDVALARSGQGFQDLVDVQRVEVLRGPQSTLFGKNASAGLISVTTEDPSDTLSGKVDGSYAQGGEWQVRGSISGPIGDHAGYRISGFYKDYDGFVENVSGISDKWLSGYRNWGGRAKFKFEPTSDLTVTLIGDYSNGRDDTVSTLRSVSTQAYANAVLPLVPSATLRKVNLNADNTNTSKQWGVSGKVEYQVNDDFQLVSITAFRKWNFLGQGDTDYTPLTTPVTGVTLWDVNTGDTELKQYSQELRLVSGDLGGFDVLLGAFAFKLDADTGFMRRTVATSAARSGQFTGSTSNSNIAAFASTNIDLTDAMQLFGGVRVLHEKLDWQVYRDPTNVLVDGDLALTGAAGTAADFTGSTSDTAVVGKIGVRHDIAGLGNVYASYARGYKGKGFNLIFAAQDTYKPVDPETSNAFELGMKIESANRAVSVNGALFYTKYDNFQAQSQLPGDVSFYLLNVGSISTKGLELEFNLRPTRLTTISLGGTFMDAKIDSYPEGPCYVGQTAAEGCVSSAQDLSGGRLPNAPDFRMTAYVKQYVPLGESLPFDTYVQSNLSYQTKVQYQLDQNPDTVQNGYAVVNAEIGLEDKKGGYSFAFFVRNLFDQNFTGNIFASSFNGGRVYQQVLRDAERYWGVRGSFSF
ncbi:TonB-dependent receptor plug domain-containing protein [Novosphingobium sp. 1949]|uniref:TonB-dependent receptor plug domain-containing protein n=1 Tax=Novosphingobium organovorum TaxID=2930092 RepID=A0ABT0BGV7_9SPHN|nr:TonB-dependent receptor [Novosphingobium organovorum]MCJ2184286.1 TonB-dependent receptor plug domain-containing protein [Novosphingobium organovorum]